MNKYLTTIFKFDAAEVAEEVEAAAEMEQKMRKEARQQMLEAKKAEHKENVEIRRAKIHQDFESMKNTDIRSDIGPMMLD